MPKVTGKQVVCSQIECDLIEWIMLRQRQGATILCVTPAAINFMKYARLAIDSRPGTN